MAIELGEHTSLVIGDEEVGRFVAGCEVVLLVIDLRRVWLRET